MRFIIPDYSTINLYKDIDKNKRKTKKAYPVKTISLLDLLLEHNAPKDIDYLSIDTEGNEYEILNTFDFNKYNIRIITCEHNYTDNRQKIYDLLVKNGYKRVLSDISRFDDWYVKIS